MGKGLKTLQFFEPARACYLAGHLVSLGYKVRWTRDTPNAIWSNCTYPRLTKIAKENIGRVDNWKTAPEFVTPTN